VGLLGLQRQRQRQHGQHRQGRWSLSVPGTTQDRRSAVFTSILASAEISVEKREERTLER
jgi:hypothetical protein